MGTGLWTTLNSTGLLHRDWSQRITRARYPSTWQTSASKEWLFKGKNCGSPVPDKSLGTGNRNIALKSGKVVARKIKAGRNLFKQNETQNLIK